MAWHGPAPDEQRYQHDILRTTLRGCLAAAALPAVVYFVNYVQTSAWVALVMCVAITLLCASCMAGLVMVRRGRLRVAASLVLAGLLVSVTAYMLCLEPRQLAVGALAFPLIILLALALKPPRVALVWSVLALGSFGVDLVDLLAVRYDRLALGISGDVALGTALVVVLLIITLLGRSISRHLREALASSEAARAEAARANAQLQEQRAELQRTEAGLAKLAFDLDESNRDLQGFARAISQGLRRPLQALGRDCRALQEWFLARLDETGREHLQGMTESARHMDALVEGLLAYSGVERSSQEVEPVALGPLLERVATVLQLRSRADLTLPANAPTVQGNRMRLEQVFSNLLDNAVKFQRPGVPPKITVECAEREDAWELAVRDNGIGIDPKHYDRLFEVFSRLHTPGEYEGTGIGLAIVRKVIEEHGGKVWVESRPGQGSAFRFTLPKAERAGAARAFAAPPAAQGAPRAASGSAAPPPAPTLAMWEAEFSEDQRAQLRRVWALAARYVATAVPLFLGLFVYGLLRRPSGAILLSLLTSSILEAVAVWSFIRVRQGELLRPARILMLALLLVMASHMLFREDAVLANGTVTFAVVLLMATSVERPALALRWFWAEVALLALVLVWRHTQPMPLFGFGELTPWVLRPGSVIVLVLFAVFGNANMKTLRDALAQSQAARAELEVLNVQLEQRKGQLLRTQSHLSALTENLTRSNRDLQSFAYVASHDLRAPLRAVVNYGRFLEEDCAAQLDDVGLRHIHDIAQSAREMDTLVAELLEYSRIGRVPVQPEWVELGPLLQSVVRALGLPEGSVSWPAELPSVWARRLRLEQILSRLIEHALGHRVEGGKPRLLVECGEGSEAWELTVRSDGLQVQDPSETRLGRAAIGLAIARKAVEEHGGQLRWESSPEGGSVAHFSLPKPR